MSYRATLALNTTSPCSWNALFIFIIIVNSFQIPKNCTKNNCSYDPTYPTAKKPQLVKLTDRSHACYQELTIKCDNTQLITPNHTYWVGQAGEHHFYFTGGNDSHPYCKCKNESKCDLGCFCAKKATGVDKGFLTNKKHLPVYHLFLNSSLNEASGNQVRLGDLICSEIFPDCHGYSVGYVETIERYERADYGPYTIDPDGLFGLPPFEVHCEFPRTIIEIPSSESRFVKLIRNGQIRIWDVVHHLSGLSSARLLIRIIQYYSYERTFCF